MKSTRHFFIAIALSVLLVLMGTAGYIIIEGWDALDALYMTIITLTTVGYKEVHTVSRAGQVYTIFLIFSGVGYFLYLIGAIIQFMIEGQILVLLGRRRLDRQIAHLKNHYIVCGYGRIGRVICKKLKEEPLNLLVIENSDDLVSVMEEDGILYLKGDAADESVLRKAGLDRAKALIAALGTDADNVFLVLTVRQMAPALPIVVRAGSERAKAKFEVAGADTVAAPYEIGAAAMAQRIIRPTVTSFLDLAFEHQVKDIQMEEIPVSSGSKLNGVILKDSGIRQNFNLIIIAIKKPDGRMLFNPSFEALIQSGDTVIAVGKVDNLKKLEAQLNSAA